MATSSSVQLKPPDNFDFSKPDNWEKWRKRFEQYRVASGLKQEDEPRQVSTLLYCMGEEAESVLSSTGISDADREKYDAVKANFDAFFKVRRNLRKSEVQQESPTRGRVDRTIHHGPVYIGRKL